MAGKKFILLGQDLDLVIAIIGNVLSWMVHQCFPSYSSYLLPKIPEQDAFSTSTTEQTKCIAIGRPGGKEQLRLITLKPGYVTCGYNVEEGGPFIKLDSSAKLPPDTVVVRICAFSINYADCCIRWGLYESANAFVGWPIVPGFDIAGIIERTSSNSNFEVGDQVFGATFFGAYSTRVLVPQNQLRKLPSNISLVQAAALPAVSLTALYTLYLGGQYPPDATNNQNEPPKKQSPSSSSILIHSCAGGVGSMLVQMSKLLQLSPVVGVVGRTQKVEAAQALGCDVVIDKSTQDLWKTAESATVGGKYTVIADANGVSTLQDSYRHVAPSGRLVVFGFHSNLPIGSDLLHPWNWIRMGWKMSQMPKFDPMDLVTANKSVLGFNLSFLVDQMEMLTLLCNQMVEWISSEKLQVPRVVEMEDVSEAHDLIQSGRSVGKIVITTKNW